MKQLTDEMLRAAASDMCGRGDTGLFQGMKDYLAYHYSFTEEEADAVIEDLDIEQMGIVDDCVFTCDRCGWHCWPDELSDAEYEAVCTNCYTDDDEETE